CANKPDRISHGSRTLTRFGRGIVLAVELSRTLSPFCTEFHHGSEFHQPLPSSLPQVHPPHALPQELPASPRPARGPRRPRECRCVELSLQPAPDRPEPPGNHPHPRQRQRDEFRRAL